VSRRPRGPGRPALEPGAGNAPTLSVRVPASVRLALAADAEQAGLTLRDYLRAVLAHAASRQRPPCPSCLRRGELPPE
jgi:hypothetical protein